MSMDMMWDEEALENNALQEFGKVLKHLQQAESILSGIDTSGMTIDLQIDSIIAIINGSKSKIGTILSSVMSVLNELNQAEIDNTTLTEELLGDALTFFGNADTSNSEKTAQLYELWKAHVQYNYSSGSAGSYRYFMLEPENADPNIPTVFLIDGDGPSGLVECNNNYIDSLMRSNSVSDYAARSSPLIAIAKGGLEYSNVRYIYILQSDYSKLCARSTNTFDNIVGDILSTNPQIDVDNMSIMGHSAGGKAATQFAAESQYTFKNVMMVSSCWSDEGSVDAWMNQAKLRGTKFYGSYSKCDTDINPNTGRQYRTVGFEEDFMRKYGEREPWYFEDSTNPHVHTYWDVFTYDGDQDGKADVLEAIWGED